MIASRSDLKFYIEEDEKVNLGSGHVGCLKKAALRLYGADSMQAFTLLKALRRLEYAENCLRKKGVAGKLVCAWRKWRYHRLEVRYNISIGVNMVGYGFRIPHTVGGGLIINCNRMGNYCSANVGVVVGNKNTPEDRPTMGDHVKLNVGSKVVGKVQVGSHVVVAPNAVVVKDVPDHCVVGGVPAKVLKSL